MESTEGIVAPLIPTPFANAVLRWLLELITQRRNSMDTKWVLIVACVVVAGLVLIPVIAHFRQGPAPASLRYGDGSPDGKKSLGGSGEMIQFTLPTSKAKLSAIRVHGARYGTPAPPVEDFVVFILSEDMSQVVYQQGAPYSLFDRGESKWVDVILGQPVTVPKTFWVVLDFKAEQTKGVYVTYDTSTGGKYSQQGLPGRQGKPVSFGGDWMIEAVLTM